jgi:FMN phosphatase YigB (HAD superfamily)
MKPIVIFDIDGTLADCSARRAKLEEDKDYEAFEEACGNDKLNYPIGHLLSSLAISNRYRIFLVSGRKEKYRQKTSDWLKYKVWPLLDQAHSDGFTIHYDSICDSLLMRKDDDNRCDTELKLEMIKYFKDEILFVVDDRQKVVDMWRREGITCLQCADFKG